MFQAIKTRYVGATNTKGAKFVATASAGRVSLSYDYDLNADQNHVRVAEALAIKFEWVKTPAEFRREYVGGGFEDGTFVFVSKKGGKL